MTGTASLANYPTLRLPFYDPDAYPAHWNSRMKQGQYAVILNDIHSDVTLEESGAAADSHATIPIFPTLAAAQSYAHEIVTRLPSAAASIYDYRGKAEGLVETIYDVSVRHRFDPVPKAWRDCLLGAVFLLAATAVITYTAMNDWRFIWTYVVGPKLLILGLGFSIRGISVLIDPERRQPEKNA